MVKNWKVNDRPFVYNEKEKFSREDEDTYNGKKIDSHTTRTEDTSPEAVAKKDEIEKSALEGAKAIADGEKSAINAAKEANDNLKGKKEETKEGKKAEKDAANVEKDQMAKKETEDKKVEKAPEEKKEALMQISGWAAEESDSDSDDE